MSIGVLFFCLRYMVSNLGNHAYFCVATEGIADMPGSFTDSGTPTASEQDTNSDNYDENDFSYDQVSLSLIFLQSFLH